MFLKRLTDPQIIYKHCMKSDQRDALDCIVEGAPLLVTKSSGHLQTLKTVFPLKNKTKTQNIQITNFEKEDSLKQETFMLRFDTRDVPTLSNIDKNTAKR